MSLKVFHIVFVTASSLLSFLFAGWVWHVSLLPGLLSAAFGVLLIAYGFWFWRKVTTLDEERRRRRKPMRPVALLLLPVVWALGTSESAACSVCYGEAEGPMIDAARIGVFLLFGLVGTMQLSFATFFVYLWRRARKGRTAHEPQES